jgi:hypothetical protein
MELTTEDKESLIAKVKDIADGPDGDLLQRLVDILHDRYDYEPLSPEELAAIQEADEAILRGDKNYFTPLEEYERERGLDLPGEVISTSGEDTGAPGPNHRKSFA